LLRQAAENEYFTESLRIQIIQLELSYLQELAVLNFTLLDKTRQYEPAMHRHRELAGQVRRDGGTPQKLDDPTRELYKQREELGKRYIEMLRALLTPEQFLELDGARRWIPRSEQQLDSSDSTSSGVHKLGGMSGKATDIKKNREEQEKKERNAGGSSTQKGTGMRGPGS
jgi:hypothetical protein